MERLARLSRRARDAAAEAAATAQARASQMAADVAAAAAAPEMPVSDHHRCLPFRLSLHTCARIAVAPHLGFWNIAGGSIVLPW